MRIILFLICFCSLFCVTSQYSLAQKNMEFSYITDKKYRVIHEFNDQVFVPAAYQLEIEEPDPIKAGKVVIRFSKNQVIFEGSKELPEPFYISNKYKSKVGFVFELMDKRNRPAKLKAVLDQDNYVFLFYFYSKKWGEHSYYLAEKSAYDLAEDKSYFTTRSKYFIRTYSNLVGKKITPYTYVADLSNGGEQEKIRKDDNFYFDFKENELVTHHGSFEIKNAKTFEYKVKENPAIKARIDLDLKGKIKKAYVYVNFKKEVEFIDIGNERYFLMP